METQIFTVTIDVVVVTDGRMPHTLVNDKIRTALDTVTNSRREDQGIINSAITGIKRS
jgi:hypothetical protein